MEEEATWKYLSLLSKVASETRLPRAPCQTEHWNLYGWAMLLSPRTFCPLLEAKNWPHLRHGAVRFSRVEVGFLCDLPALRGLRDPGTSGVHIPVGCHCSDLMTTKALLLSPLIPMRKSPVSSACASPLPPAHCRRGMWLLWWCVPAHLHVIPARWGLGDI